MPSLHLHDEKLKCPYKGCGKSFDKPAVLTDSTMIPRKSYYACPHCQSKLDVLIEGFKIRSLKTIEYPKVLDSPAKCARFNGFLNSFQKDSMIPDECLICPKVLQCSVRQERE